MGFTKNSCAVDDLVSQHIDAIRRSILSRENDALGAVVLGGGYGRGEGGVYLRDGQECVYNDYDFFVIVPYSSRIRRNKLMAVLAEVKAEMEPICGIHIDFSPPMPLSSLPSLPYEVMFMELKEGHHVVIGPPDILSSMPEYDVAHPPLEECARLFMNRGIGLLLARQKLNAGEMLNADDHEFVVRNIRKAQLAMGDSLLFLHGCYSASYVERRSRFFSLDLSQTPDAEILSRYYAEAIDFKLRPQHQVPDGHTLISWHREVVSFYEIIFLWFERQRLGDRELNWKRYGELTRRLPYSGIKELAINILRNLRIKTEKLPSPNEWFLHPRDRVLARLPRLLFSEKCSDDALTDILLLWKYCG